VYGKEDFSFLFSVSDLYPYRLPAESISLLIKTRDVVNPELTSESVTVTSHNGERLGETDVSPSEPELTMG